MNHPIALFIEDLLNDDNADGMTLLELKAVLNAIQNNFPMEEEIKEEDLHKHIL